MGDRHTSGSGTVASTNPTRTISVFDVSGGSWPASLRDRIWVTAEVNAETKIRNAAQLYAPEPGRTTITGPRKPITTATVRAGPTRSASRSGASAVTISG